MLERATNGFVSRRGFLALAAVAGGSIALKMNTAEAVTRNVKDFGARGDGRADDSAAIRAAIYACWPGDTLVFPGGTYRVTTQVRPADGLTLDFQSGAKIVQDGHEHLVFFDHVSDVTTKNMRLRHNGNNRTANPLRIDGCSNMTFLNTVIERTDAWSCYVLGGSKGITFDGYTVLTAQEKSTNVDDGIDFAECSNVVLRNFDIRTNDDAISFKSWGSGTSNVTVENGTIRSRDAGITFGTELEVGLSNITIRNVNFVDSGVPFYFKGYDERYSGAISNISIRNITVNDTAGRTQRVVFFHTYGSRTNKTKGISIDGLKFKGPIEWDFIHIQRSNDISITNSSFEATEVRNAARATRNRWGIFLEGAPGSVFQGLTFKGVSEAIRLAGAPTKANRFSGFSPDQASIADGARKEDQIWVTAATPTSTPTATQTPAPATQTPAPATSTPAPATSTPAASPPQAPVTTPGGNTGQSNSGNSNNGNSGNSNSSSSRRGTPTPPPRSRR